MSRILRECGWRPKASTALGADGGCGWMLHWTQLLRLLSPFGNKWLPQGLIPVGIGPVSGNYSAVDKCPSDHVGSTSTAVQASVTVTMAEVGSCDSPVLFLGFECHAFDPIPIVLGVRTILDASGGDLKRGMLAFPPKWSHIDRTMNGKKLGDIMTSMPEAELWVMVIFIDNTGQLWSWGPGQQMLLVVVALMSMGM